MENNSEYALKSGFARMDFDSVTEMLAEAYWSKGIKNIENRGLDEKWSAIY
jgi:hypothetical protein